MVKVMTVKLEGVGSETILPIAIGSPKTIHSLPQELLEQIFSLLSKEDLQAAALVNRGISSSVIAAASFNEPTEIKNFISVLIQRLSAEIFPGQRETLLEILHNVTPPNFVNLRLLKGDILGVKAQLINVIRTLDTETANNLRDHVHLPHFFENIFELSAFERQIDRAIAVATSIPNENERGYALRDISRALTQAGNIDRAIAVATSIPNENERGYALRDML